MVVVARDQHAGADQYQDCDGGVDEQHPAPAQVFSQRPAGQRGQREHDNPEAEYSSPAEQVAGPAAEEQQPAERERVKADHPVQVGRRQVQRPLHARQGDVHDGVVEHQHELRGGDDEQRKAGFAAGGGWRRDLGGGFCSALERHGQESFPASQAAGSPAAFQMSRAAYLGPHCSRKAVSSGGGNLPRIASRVCGFASLSSQGMYTGASPRIRSVWTWEKCCHSCGVSEASIRASPSVSSWARCAVSFVTSSSMAVSSGSMAACSASIASTSATRSGCSATWVRSTGHTASSSAWWWTSRN